jgi:hypothetical protein
MLWGQGPHLTWAHKTHYMQFVTKTSSLIDLHVMCKNKEIANTCNTNSLGRLSKESVQVRGSLEVFVTSSFFYSEGLLTPRPTPKLEGHPLLSVHDCLFNTFAANLHIWRPFLHLQPEDAPCLGDRDPT